jgi:hypothetical protein
MQGRTYWNGTIWGTNAGPILVELERNGQRLSGSFLLIEPALGATRAKIEGIWKESDEFEAALEQFTGDFSVPVQLPKDGYIEGKLDASKSVIEGKWKTASGTNGKFVMALGPKIDPQLPIQQVSATQAISPSKDQVSSQSPNGPLVTTTLNLSSVRLDKVGLTNLAEVIKEGTAVDNPTINATHRGREYIHTSVSSLLQEPALPDSVETVIIAANEPIIGRGFKTVVVRLIKDGQNTIYVSGYDRIWVEGKARQIEVFLKNYQSKTVGFWRKYGANVNGLLFLVLIGILPSIPSLSNRMKVIAVTFLLLVLLRLTWAKSVNTRVFLRGEVIPRHIRYAEYILTPLAVIFSAIVAYLIQRYVHPH